MKRRLKDVEPQAHPRCHNCWNLAPCCYCDGGMPLGDPDPGAGISLAEVEEVIHEFHEMLKESAHAG